MTLYEQIVQEMMSTNASALEAKASAAKGKEKKARNTQLATDWEDVAKVITFAGKNDTPVGDLYDIIEPAAAPLDRSCYTSSGERFQTCANLASKLIKAYAGRRQTKDETARVERVKQALINAGLLSQKEDKYQKETKDDINNGVTYIQDLIKNPQMGRILGNLFTSIVKNNEAQFARMKKLNGEEDAESTEELNEAKAKSNGLPDDLSQKYDEAIKTSNKLGLRIGKNPFYKADFREALDLGMFNEMEHICLIYVNPAKRTEELNNLIKKLSIGGVKIPSQFQIEKDAPENAQDTDYIYAEEGAPLWSRIYAGYGAGADAKPGEEDFQGPSNTDEFPISKNTQNTRISSSGLRITFLDGSGHYLSPQNNKAGDEQDTKLINSLLHLDNLNGKQAYTAEPVGNRQKATMTINGQKVSFVYNVSRISKKDYNLVTRASFFNFRDPDNWGEDMANSTIEASEDGSLRINDQEFAQDGENSIRSIDLSIDHKQGDQDVRLYRKSLQLMTRTGNTLKASNIHLYQINVTVNTDEFNQELKNNGVKGAVSIEVAIDSNNKPYVGYKTLSNPRVNKTNNIICTTEIRTSQEGNPERLKLRALESITYTINGGLSSNALYVFPLEDNLRTGHPIIPTIQHLLVARNYARPNESIRPENIGNVIKLCTVGKKNPEMYIDDEVIERELPFSWVTNQSKNLKLIDFNPQKDSDWDPSQAQTSPLNEDYDVTSIDSGQFKGEKNAMATNIIRGLKRVDANLPVTLQNIRNLYPDWSDINVYRGASSLQFGGQFIFYAGGNPEIFDAEDLPEEKWRNAMWINRDGFICYSPDSLKISNYGRVKNNGKINVVGLQFGSAYPTVNNIGKCIRLGNTRGIIETIVEQYETSDSLEIEGKGISCGSVDIHKLVCGTWNLQQMLRLLPKDRDAVIPAGNNLIVHHIDSNPHHYSPTNLIFVNPRSNTQADQNIKNPSTGYALFLVNFNGAETALLAWEENDKEFLWRGKRQCFYADLHPAFKDFYRDYMWEPEDITNTAKFLRHFVFGGALKTKDEDVYIASRKVIFRDHDMPADENEQIDPQYLAKQVIYYYYSPMDENAPKGYYPVDEKFDAENVIRPYEADRGEFRNRVSDVSKGGLTLSTDNEFKIPDRTQSALSYDDMIADRNRTKRGLYHDATISGHRSRLAKVRQQRPDGSWRDTEKQQLAEGICGLMERMGMRLD